MGVSQKVDRRLQFQLFLNFLLFRPFNFEFEFKTIENIANFAFELPWGHSRCRLHEFKFNCFQLFQNDQRTEKGCSLDISRHHVRLPQVAGLVEYIVDHRCIILVVLVLVHQVGLALLKHSRRMTVFNTIFTITSVIPGIFSKKIKKKTETIILNVEQKNTKQFSVAFIQILKYAFI